MFTHSKINDWRLGNAMFAIASTIGRAKKNRALYGFKPWDYAYMFKNELPPVTKPYIPLKGYMQDYREFDVCTNIIRHHFTPKPCAPPLPNYVFIHFRAYSDEGVEDRHPEQDSEYYKKAMSFFPKYTKFVLFSDNIEKALKVVPMCDVFSEWKMESDFYQMSTCQGGIISNSTFAWWAGWLTGGKVVAPSKWFSGKKETMTTSGYYPSNFIRL